MGLGVESSSTSRLCSIVTPGKISPNCVSDTPSSRFAKRAATGIRVPQNTQAPVAPLVAFALGIKQQIRVVARNDEPSSVSSSRMR